MFGNGGELAVVDVDRDPGGAESAGDLHAVAADAAGADHHREAARRHARAAHRLIRRGERVGHDRDLGQFQPGAFEPPRKDFAQAASRHHDVRGEAALDVVAGHFLRAADGGEAAAAQVAFAAGQHRRDNHGLAQPALGALARTDDAAADFVTERQRQRLVGAHAVVQVPEVGVAHSATRDGDDHLPCLGGGLEALAHHGCVGCGHQPAVCIDAHGGRAFQTVEEKRIVVMRYHFTHLGHCADPSCRDH
jgi:hypothetical protein